MIRTPRYKYTRFSRGKRAEQLFDLESDPGETRNLAEEADSRPILEECRGLLKGWQKETGDQVY